MFFTLIIVRLVSPSNSPSSGRVEVFYNGTWGTICDNSWDIKDANTVCRQLGYDGALSAPGDAAFRQGIGQIWLDDVNCIRNETLIAQCSHGGWGVHNCGHGKDAGVVCQPAGNATSCVQYINIYLFTEDKDTGFVLRLGFSISLDV